LAEAADADKPDDPAEPARSNGRRWALSVCLVAALAAGGLLTYKRALRDARTTRPRGTAAEVIPAVSAAKVRELETALRANGAEISTPEERGYRAVIPTQTARRLAAQIPPGSAPYAAALKAVADSQFQDARRLLDEAAARNAEPAWRIAMARSVLDIYTGDSDAAAREAASALKLRPGDPDVLLQNAVALLNAGRFDAALKMANECVRVQESQGKGAAARLADAVETRGAASAALGRIRDAEADYRRSVHIRSAFAGSEAGGTARILNRLAALCDAQGRSSEAEQLYGQALAVARKRYGNGSPEAAICLNNMAGHFAELRQFSKAEPLFRQALDLLVRALGEQNLETAQTLNNLAGLYADEGKTEQAEDLFARVLRNQVNAAGPDSPDAAQTMDNLAGLYARQHRYREAEALYRRELAVREKVLGKSHRDTAVTLNNLACLLTRMDHWTQAEEQFLRAIAIHEKSATQDVESANAYDNYAVLLRKEHRVTPARMYEARARAIRRSLNGR
jgi:tetratricopeptide (TPR) repeat protein